MAMVNVSPPTPPEDNASVARQTAVGSSYTMAASAVTVMVGFTRTIILARLLFPADFGLFALAFFFVRLLERVQLFGFTAAFVHRKNHTQEDAAAHFILRMMAGLLVIGLALLLTPLLPRFYPQSPLLGPVIVVMTAVRLILAFNTTPKTILSKQLQFRRLATLQVGGSLLSLFLTGWLAWRGAGVWSLVAQEFSIFIVEWAGLWLFRRPWKISLKTSWETIKWYFQFGKYHIFSKNMSVLLDTFDDFWIGTITGNVGLGFYAKAYNFAQYPRIVIADPVNNVLFPTFAKLQNNRQPLSRAFFRASFLLVRAGFLFAGTFVFVVPEFIQLFLGEKWLPMQLTFQLLLVYTLLDPLLALANQLILAMGQPKILARAQIWQVLFFIPAVIIANHYYGINGVAVAADLMLLLGFVVLLPKLRHFVDFSLWQITAVPILALTVALLASWWLILQLPVAHTAVTLAQKALILPTIYTTLLLLFEREQLSKSGAMIQSLLIKNSNQENNPQK